MPHVRAVELEDLAPTLSSAEWASGALYFVGDVGATYARLGFGRLADAAAVVDVVFVRFPMRRGSIREVLDFFAGILARVEGVGGVLSRIRAGVVSVPGPVSRGGLAGPFNNLDGQIALREFPRALFPFSRAALLNDVQAGAHGVLALGDALTPHYGRFFTRMWGPEGAEEEAEAEADAMQANPPNRPQSGVVGEETIGNGPRANDGRDGNVQDENRAPRSVLGRGPCLVLAPGTGLGSALILYHEAAHCYQVLPLEFGCTGVSALVMRAGEEPGKPSLTGLAKRLGCAAWEMKVEDLVCGSSLVYHYACEAAKDGHARHPADSPEAIADFAKAGDPAARRALLAVYTHLFRCCSNTIMSFLPSNCVIIGDNVVKNQFLLSDAACEKALHDALHEHSMSKRGFMSRTTFFRQVKDINLNLLGCLGYGIQLGNSWNKNPIFDEVDS
ncbi:unnamed protein product [Phytomonas sp. EM1]|nr:unnamed protein product [Phytomonas sp. EM1]|eukprot:CCW60096.1 unnamed protein product [Phytomonas sp. isolate EM1]